MSSKSGQDSRDEDALDGKTVQNNNLHLEKKYEKLNQRLQLVSFILALITIVFAYLSIRLESSNNRLQASLTDFEKNQRVVEMAVTLGTYWEERLDVDTRHRARRFMDTLDKLKSLPEEQNAFLSAFLNGNIQNDSLGNVNKHLVELLNPAHNPDSGNISRANLTVELSKYKSALIRLLNTMEMIAIVREYTRDPAARNVLKYAYESSIKQRYDILEPFIRAYQENDETFREVPAWYLLDEMIKELRGSESSARAKP